MLSQKTLTYSPEILSIYRLSGEIVTYSIFVIALWSIVNLAKFKNAYRWLLLNICISACVEIISVVLVKFGVNNTQPINYFYLIQEVSLIGFFYFNSIKRKKITNIIRYFLPIFIVFIIFNAFWKEGYWETPGKTALFEAIIFTVLGLILHRQIIVDTKVSNLSRNPLFWFNIYIIVSYSANILFFLIINNALKLSDDLSMILYIIKNSIGLMCYVFWLVGTNRLNKFYSHQPHL